MFSMLPIQLWHLQRTFAPRELKLHSRLLSELRLKADSELRRSESPQPDISMYTGWIAVPSLGKCIVAVEKIAIRVGIGS